MENLFDLCCDYIEDSHNSEGQMIANELTYNDCCTYIMSTTDCPKYIENRLRNHFSKYLN